MDQLSRYLLQFKVLEIYESSLSRSDRLVKRGGSRAGSKLSSTFSLAALQAPIQVERKANEGKSFVLELARLEW